MTAAAQRSGAERAAEARAKAATEAYAGPRPALVEMHAKRLSLQEIANELNTQGRATRRAKPWNAVQVAPSLRSTERE